MSAPQNVRSRYVVRRFHGIGVSTWGIFPEAKLAEMGLEDRTQIYRGLDRISPIVSSPDAERAKRIAARMAAGS